MDDDWNELVQLVAKASTVAMQESPASSVGDGEQPLSLVGASFRGFQPERSGEGQSHDADENTKGKAKEREKVRVSRTRRDAVPLTLI